MLRIRLSLPEQFLIECIRHKDALNAERLSSLFLALGDEQAYALCAKNNILSLAADSLLFVGIKLPDRWHRAHYSMQVKINEYLSELDRAAKLLSANDIPLVALKNSGIARAIYVRPAASPMGDIDVLVDKKNFRSAHKLLLDHGYEFKFRSPLEDLDLDSAERSGGAEYSVCLPSGRKLWFELQWRPVAGRWIRSDQEPTASELFERSIPITGSNARLLSPEDNLLQVCLHTAKHSYVRAPGFRLHTDVDRIVRAYSIDWDVFVNNVWSLDVRTPVFFSLAFASDLLSTPIPNSVFNQLSLPRWKVYFLSGWLQRVGLFDPDSRKWGRITYILFVALLYDSIQGFLLALLPNTSGKINIKSLFNYPFLFISRICSLAFYRTLN